MAIETGEYEAVEIGLEMDNWVVGALSGFIGGSLFGAMMAATPMMENVAALFGLAAPSAGWLIHLSISIVFAWGFISVVSLEPLETYAQRPSTGAGMGLVYGVFLWFVAATVLMPLWLTGELGIDANFMSFVGHLIYGVVLGAIYPILLAHN
jgi:uncharacterized membrane protein YagU involved in acid resistance